MGGPRVRPAARHRCCLRLHLRLLSRARQLPVLLPVLLQPERRWRGGALLDDAATKGPKGATARRTPPPLVASEQMARPRRRRH